MTSTVHNHLFRYLSINHACSCCCTKARISYLVSMDLSFLEHVFLKCVVTHSLSKKPWLSCPSYISKDQKVVEKASWGDTSRHSLFLFPCRIYINTGSPKLAGTSSLSRGVTGNDPKNDIPRILLVAPAHFF